MTVQKDALSPLHPPSPTAPPVVDASLDAEHDKRRLRFDKIKHMPENQQYTSLSALIEEFIAAGHNPRDPNDVMFNILGISPEFLEALLFALKKKVPVHTLSPDPEYPIEVEQAPEEGPTPITQTN